EIISNIARGNRQELFDLAIAQRQNLYAKSVAIGDYRAALSILQDRDRLLDLYPAKRTEVTGAHGEALYPSLSAMVVAIVKQENTIEATTLEILEGGGQENESRNSARD